MMNMPKIGFGKGFVNPSSLKAPSIGSNGEVPVYPVNVSNGMPVVSPKVPLSEKAKGGWPKKLKKGRFTKYCKSKGHSGPNASCAKDAMKSNDSSVRGMASFYMNTVQPGGKTVSDVSGKKK